MSTIEVPQEILESARATVPELQMELAIWLYAQGRLSLGKARELAGMALSEFRHLLASRRIAAHFDEADFADDLSAIEALRAK